MGMTPNRYLDTFVMGNYYDFVEEPGEIRRAFNAAVALSHCVDHYFTFNKRHHPDLVSGFAKLGDFVEHIATQTGGAFRDVRSVSNAYKHLYTDVGQFADYATLNSCGSIESLDLSADVEIASVDCEYGPDTGHELTGVVITRKDGTRAVLLPLVRTVYEYLCDHVRPPLEVIASPSDQLPL